MKLVCFMLLAALCFVLGAAAFAEETDFDFSLNSSGNGYVVTKYNGSAGSVTIPDWYNNLPVTEIGSGAFEGNTALKAVSLPSVITRIGKAAFKNCTNLSKISSYKAAENPPAADRVPGDVNGDGKVDAKDGLLVMQYDAGWNVSIDPDNADVNANGAADLGDAVLIFQYAAGQEVTLK